MGKIADFLEKMMFDDTETTKRSIGSHSFADIASNTNQLWAYQMARATASERIGAVLSKCDVKTYLKGNEIKKDIWYRFNYEPNPNQTSCEFMKQLVTQLIWNQEVLIVQLPDGYYVASQFNKDEYQIKPTYFRDVSINIYDDEDLALDGTFSGENAIYIKYVNKGVKQFLNSMNKLYTSITNNLKDIQTNDLKYTLTIDQSAMADEDLEQHLKTIINEDFETFVKNNNVIMPLYNGFELKDMSKGSNAGQNAQMADSTLTDMYTEIFSSVGKAYNIPLSIMKGTFEENDMDAFLTFCIDPLADLISEALSRKLYGKEEIQNDSYLMIDTKKIKHFDILTVSNSINKLISSGVYTINDIRKIMDEKQVDAEIGDKHWITRNYAIIGDYLQDETNYTEYKKEDSDSSKNDENEDESVKEEEN